MAICSLTWPNYSLSVHARSRSPTLYTRTHTQIKLKDTSCPLLKLTHVIVLCCEIATAVQCCYYTSQPWSLLLLLIFLQLYILRYSANMVGRTGSETEIIVKLYNRNSFPSVYFVIIYLYQIRRQIWDWYHPSSTVLYKCLLIYCTSR